MTVKRTTWGPDTCACRLTYEWDDALDPLLRIHTLVATENKCPAHAAMVDDSILAVVLEENRRKNIAASIARVELGRATDDPMQWYVWVYTAERMLQASFVEIQVSQNVKTRIQNLCDLQFGPGKVQIL